MLRVGTLKSAVFGLMIATGLTMSGAMIGLAQEEAAPSHPSHIHAGTCDDLDPNPVAPLKNIEPRMAEDDDESAGDPVGILTAAPVLYADSEDVDMSWDDMLAESHALNVHESKENVETYVACGDIGGVVIDDTLVIALNPQNDSGYSGIAILEKDDDGNVDVEVYLAAPASDQNEAEATPVS